MKYLLALSLTLMSINLSARDIGVDEVVNLVNSGKIQSFDKLNQLALAQHPNAVIYDTELEQFAGRYVYQLELTDNTGQEWDMELDANTGEILANHTDD
jgi:uncharacterized membrane protein YkoI